MSTTVQDYKDKIDEIKTDLLGLRAVDQPFMFRFTALAALIFGVCEYLFKIGVAVAAYTLLDKLIEHL